MDGCLGGKFTKYVMQIKHYNSSLCQKLLEVFGITLKKSCLISITYFVNSVLPPKNASF